VAGPGSGDKGGHYTTFIQGSHPAGFTSLSAAPEAAVTAVRLSGPQLHGLHVQPACLSCARGRGNCVPACISSCWSGFRPGLGGSQAGVLSVTSVWLVRLAWFS